MVYDRPSAGHLRGTIFIRSVRVGLPERVAQRAVMRKYLIQSNPYNGRSLDISLITSPVRVARTRLIFHHPVHAGPKTIMTNILQRFTIGSADAAWSCPEGIAPAHSPPSSNLPR